MLSRTLALTLALAMITACTSALASTANTQSIRAADANVSDAYVAPGQNVTQGPTRPLPPPRDDSVLYYISNVDGNGALSYETVNGSWINYWYGFQFELGGTRYYTGFAWETPQLFGADRENHFAAPDTKVTLMHATFIANKPGTKEPWNWQGTELYIGEFGGSEKGNQVDTERQPQTWNTPSGDMLLALPTWYLVSGVRMRTIEILLFNPHELDQTDEKRWRYLATLEAGYNNEANCGPESAGAIPCVNTTGVLSILARQGHDLPLLRVSVPGPGSQAEAVTEYHYDAASKTYL